MKKKLRLFAVAAFAATVLTTGAGASNFDNCAEKLKSLDLFQGTEQGYDLDRAPTRAEAAVMLVRMLGKENDAKALEYTAPFTDLKGWEKPYVQYLYDNGLINGSDSTSFSPNDQCNAKMYSAFLLRALGYSDTEGDFTYDNALKFAEEKGLVDAYSCDEGNFLRDHIAAMSLNALHASPKSADTRLINKLVESGAVDSAKAAPVIEFFDNFDEIYADSSISTTAIKAVMSANVQMTAKMLGTDLLDVSIPMDIAADIDINDISNMKMAITGNAKLSSDSPLLSGEEGVNGEMPFKMYYANDTYYMEIDNEKVKMTMPMKEILEEAAKGSSSNNCLGLIDSIKKNGESYSFAYNERLLNNIVKESLTVLDDSGVNIDVSVSNVGYDVKLDENKLPSVNMKMTVTAMVSGTAVDVDLSMDLSIDKMGDDVVVTLPDDLDSYTDLSLSNIEE